MRAIAMATALALLPVPALPHDLWSNGQPIPDWIKSSCCGAADAHHLTPEQITRRDEDYYLVAGYADLRRRILDLLSRRSERAIGRLLLFRAQWRSDFAIWTL